MNNNIRLYDFNGNDFDIYFDNTYDYETIPNYFEMPKDSWLFMYGLAHKYYESYGDLKIKQEFRTKDGVNYDEEGYPLGVWIQSQRVAYRINFIPKEERTTSRAPLSKSKIALLEEIGMIFDCNIGWDFMYGLAHKYYEKYGDLKIKQEFRTKDGMNYDEEGYALGIWIQNQRVAYKNIFIPKEERTTLRAPLSQSKIGLLEEIDMIFEPKKRKVLKK